MTSFVIKLIAAASMLCDHAGLLLFPSVGLMRIIGRLAFPLYAWCIAEGFRYTRNRLKYFLRVFILGALCQIVYMIVDDDLYLGILITFSMSIILMACADCVKKASRGQKSALGRLAERIVGHEITCEEDKAFSAAVTCGGIILAFLLTVYVQVDYGFFGIMLPVFTSMFEDRSTRLVMFTACLIALCIDMTQTFSVQYWSLVTIPILALYNGKPGRVRMKYFFYIFYPVHLVVLYAIQMLIK